MVGIYLFFHVTEAGWGKRGGKGEGVVGKFLLELFVRISFPFPWVLGNFYFHLYFQ